MNRKEYKYCENLNSCNHSHYITSTVTSQELERINCLCRLYLRFKDTLALRLPGNPVKSAADSQKAIEENFNAEIILDLRECCRKLKVSPKAIFLSTYRATI
jgi:hypothetical protein